MCVKDSTHKELVKRELLPKSSLSVPFRAHRRYQQDLVRDRARIPATHPLYARPLVNRNRRRAAYYQRGGDEWRWELPQTNERLPDVPPITTARAAALAKRRATRMARGM